MHTIYVNVGKYIWFDYSLYVCKWCILWPLTQTSTYKHTLRNIAVWFLKTHCRWFWDPNRGGNIKLRISTWIQPETELTDCPTLLFNSSSDFVEHDFVYNSAACSLGDMEALCNLYVLLQNIFQ